MSEVDQGVSTEEEPERAVAVEAHVLFPRDCWAALERLAAMQQKTESQTLVEAVALAHYLDLELAAGSELVTRRPSGKSYVLHFPWLQATAARAIRGDVSSLTAARGAPGIGGPLAWPDASELSEEEEDLIRAMRLEELRTAREVARIQNERRIHAARREQEQDRTLWNRLWRRRGQ